MLGIAPPETTQIFERYAALPEDATNPESFRALAPAAGTRVVGPQVKALIRRPSQPRLITKETRNETLDHRNVGGLSALIAATPRACPALPRRHRAAGRWQPEGIAAGAGNAFYVGAIPTGAIYRGDLRTGTGGVAVQPRPGRMAAGIKVDARDRIFVAGAFTGQAYVHDARTGTTLTDDQLGAPGATMVNDVALTNDAAWPTDSLRAVLYRVPLARNGTLGGQSDVQEVPLTGDFELAGGFNANGIDATPDGKTLIAVQTNLGRPYRIDYVAARGAVPALSRKQQHRASRTT